jgi:type IV pilus assembly protein PilX
MTSNLNRRRQQGVSLIIAIIILGAMMMSGIAMFRKLSASAIISGNLAFTTSAIAASDTAAEDSRALLRDPIQLTATQREYGAPGYFPAHCHNEQTDLVAAVVCGNTPFDPTTFSWEGQNNSRLVTANDGAGNEVRYVIHRLCAVSGSLGEGGQLCNESRSTGGGSGSGGGGATIVYGGLALGGVRAPHYRITTRVRGPRNALVYTQVTLL